MIDFHSHFLPQMDDGSKSLEESLQMLQMSYDMGIDVIVSTSHYHAEYESIDEFLNRRIEKLKFLNHALEDRENIPRLIMGAEVSFYSGISGDREIPQLCIGNSKCILLEMPYSQWSSIILNEVKGLISRGITPIIAHIERYFDVQLKNKKIEELLNIGAVAQINGESFSDISQRKFILKLIKDKKFVLLGSDCHNMKDRRPNLDEACRVIEKKLGPGSMNKIEKYGHWLLKNDFRFC